MRVGGAGVRKPPKEETAARKKAGWAGATYGDLKLGAGAPGGVPGPARRGLADGAEEVAAWKRHRNKHNAKANWQFTTVNGPVELKRLYPQFE